MSVSVSYDAQRAAGASVLGALWLPGLDGDVWEVWESGAPVDERGVRGGVAFARSRGVAFLWCATEVSPGRMEAAAREAYSELLDVSEALGCRFLLRVGNYIPGIGTVEDGRERYWAFNAGRQAAFAGRRRAADAPAACGMGCEGDRLRIYVLAGDTPGRNVENPRQVSAFAYPTDYGPQAPMFARATIAAGLLMVSGTASIVGHRSLHAGDVGAQTDEILRNLDAVLGEAARMGAAVGLGGLRAKVYLRRPRDRAVVAARLRAAGFPEPAAWVRAEICRRDLDVEIEASSVTDGE